MTKEEILAVEILSGDLTTESIAQKINKYATQEKQGWVKIASPETMPPYFEHVIVFGGEVHCRLFSKAWVALPHDEFISRTGISHWMPLPQKPEV